MTWFISQHRKSVGKFISCLLMNITRKVKMCFALVLLLPKYHIFFWAQQKAFQNPIFLHMEALWDMLNYTVRPKPNCSSWILPSLTTCSRRSKVSCRKCDTELEAWAHSAYIHSSFLLTWFCAPAFLTDCFLGYPSLLPKQTNESSIYSKSGELPREYLMSLHVACESQASW